MNMSGSFDAGNIYRCIGTALQHDIVIAGYDDAGYWIVKNSWGATWGPDGDGYFKVGYGECAIESLVTYATFAQAPTPVGGLAELPDVSDSSGRNYIALAALAAAATLALTAGGWYARRQLLR